MKKEIESNSREQVAFLSIRDSFFIDPKKPINPDFVEATKNIVERLTTNKCPGNNTTKNSSQSDILLFTDRLTGRFVGARNFNELSMAQIHPSGCEPAILANLAATIKNNNTIVGEVSPVETVMENECLDWLNREIAGYEPVKACGAIVEGGTAANTTGLLIAREKLLIFGQNGMVWNGREPVTVLSNELAHYSISKACEVLGPPGLIKLVKIPVDCESYAMKMDVLEAEISRCKRENMPIMAIVAVAGETETGIVDELDSIADLAGENDIYLHVDGAYGAAFNLSKRKELFKGMERSNSLTFDPHKYLYTPYPNGAILFQNQEEHSLIERFNADGDAYMFKPEKNDGGTFKERTMNNHGKRRLSGSFGGQASASLWSVINTLGKDGIKLVLDHTIDVTDYAYKQLFGSNLFNTLCQPDLNTLCIYPKNREILKDLDLEKRLVEETSKRMDKRGIYISTTTLPFGEEKERRLTVFRMVITNPYTEQKQVNMAIEGLHGTWEEVISEYKRKLIF
jgi:glutamate/tyrosine decarboxylase-like PLP-dependent enzyme